MNFLPRLPPASVTVAGGAGGKKRAGAGRGGGAGRCGPHLQGSGSVDAHEHHVHRRVRLFQLRPVHQPVRLRGAPPRPPWTAPPPLPFCTQGAGAGSAAHWPATAHSAESSGLQLQNSFLSRRSGASRSAPCQQTCRAGERETCLQPPEAQRMAHSRCSCLSIAVLSRARRFARLNSAPANLVDYPSYVDCRHAPSGAQ